MNTRIAFCIKMTPDKLMEIQQYVSNAREHMQEGQSLRIEVSHNVDFVFEGLKNFGSSTASGRDSETLDINSKHLSQGEY